MGLDKIPYWKTLNYRKVFFAEFENVLMCLMTYFFAIIKDIVLLKIYFESLVFSRQNAIVLRFEIVIDIKLLV